MVGFCLSPTVVLFFLNGKSFKFLFISFSFLPDGISILSTLRFPPFGVYFILKNDSISLWIVWLVEHRLLFLLNEPGMLIILTGVIFILGIPWNGKRDYFQNLLQKNIFGFDYSDFFLFLDFCSLLRFWKLGSVRINWILNFFLFFLFIIFFWEKRDIGINKATKGMWFKRTKIKQWLESQ